jgi:two-component system, chemotaxis family, chemotaxis protein CheY
MAADFRRLGILCVDDSGFLRTLVMDCLKALRVGHVHLAEDGVKAAEMLRRRAEDPALALANPVDIIISNWQMKAGDGLTFLKWVRTSEKSPDRFAPFLMFTAFTDIEHVQQARDNGVDDIIAKPFSVKTLRDKILMLIMRDIVYIETASYFGPDRRRQKLEFSGEDRRLLKPDDQRVQIISHGSAEISPTETPAQQPLVKIHRLKNPLQERTGILQMASEAQKTAETASLQKAQDVLERFADDYPRYAEDQVLELLSLRRKLSIPEMKGALSTEQTAKMMDGIKAITHDLVGQGGTFGFPLVTRAAKSLNMLAGKITQLDDRKSELVQTHIKLLQLILQQKHSGEDHPQVQDAIIGLEIAVQKCLS